MGNTQPQTALPVLFGNWWAMVLRRIVAVLFGLAALFWPGAGLVSLMSLVGIYAMSLGVALVVLGVYDRG